MQEPVLHAARSWSSQLSDPLCGAPGAARHDPAAERARDRTEAGPGRVAHQPQAGNAEGVRNRLLVGVGGRLPYAADRAARPEGIVLVRPWRADLPDASLFTEPR